MEESELTKGKAIVLNEKNLGEYRQWLKHVREKVRAEQGRLTESHLIGEVLPDSDASNDDVNVPVPGRHGSTALPPWTPAGCGGQLGTAPAPQHARGADER